MFQEDCNILVNFFYNALIFLSISEYIASFEIFNMVI